MISSSPPRPASDEQVLVLLCSTALYHTAACPVRGLPEAVKSPGMQFMMPSKKKGALPFPQLARVCEAREESCALSPHRQGYYLETNELLNSVFLVWTFSELVGPAALHAVDQLAALHSFLKKKQLLRKPPNMKQKGQIPRANKVPTLLSQDM